jgi:Glycosyltransferase family 87
VPRLRDRLDPRLSQAGLVTLLIAGALVYIALTTAASGDYAVHGEVGGDNPGPGIAALLHGHLGAYAARQPAMGLTSILLRLPFVAAASAVGGGDLLGYRLGAISCLLPLAVLAGWLVTYSPPDRTRRALALLTVAVLLIGPMLRESLSAGHPEEVLAGALAAGAVIAAMRGRVHLAAALVGLAIGAKQWGVIALPPVLIAVPGRRREVCLLAGALAALLVGVAPLADPHAFLQSARAVGQTHLVNEFSPLWPLGTSVRLAGGALGEAHRLPLGLTRSIACALVMAGALAGFLLYRRRRQGRGGLDPLALLALLAMLRCVCDPGNIQYYFVPVLIAVACCEVTGGRVPALTAALTVAVAALYSNTLGLSAATLCAASTVGSVGVLMVLARRTLGIATDAGLQLNASVLQRTRPRAAG